MAKRSVLDVTVVLLGDGPTSTAIMPVEIFSFAGVLWNDRHNRPPEPGLLVLTVSVDGRSTRSPYGLFITPEGSIDDVERTDIVNPADVGPGAGSQVRRKLRDTALAASPL